MSPVPSSTAAVAAIGLALGIRHAFEPDHLAAVSTLATRQRRWSGAIGLALAWAGGHTASVGVVTLALVLTGVVLPERWAAAADFAVGGLLVVLGISVWWRYATGRWHMHEHEHAHDGQPHVHLHSHGETASHQHRHAVRGARGSLGFGVLHGLAGSGAIIALLLAAAPGAGARIAYFLAFGIGTAIGMTIVTATIGAATHLAQGGRIRWATWLQLGAASASVAVGVMLAVGVAGQLQRP